MKHILKISAWMCLGLQLFAQTPASISGPLVGLVSTANGIRPIIGVLGACTLGEPISLPDGISHAFLAPSQPWAVVTQNGVAGIVRFNGITPGPVTPIPAAFSNPATVGFSPSGRSAILISDRSSSSTMQVLSHLDSSPQVSLEIDLSQLDVRTVVIDDDGMFPVVLTTEGELYLLKSSGSAMPIFRTGPRSAVGFLPNQQVLAVADGSATAIVMIDGLSSQPFTRQVVSGPSLSGTGAFLQGSSDGNSLILSSGKSIYHIDLTNQTLSVVNLQVSAARLDRLNGDLFVVSANPNEAAWLALFDGVSLKVGFAQSTDRPLERTPIRRTAQTLP